MTSKRDIQLIADFKEKSKSKFGPDAFNYDNTKIIRGVTKSGKLAKIKFTYVCNNCLFENEKTLCDHVTKKPNETGGLRGGCKKCNISQKPQSKKKEQDLLIQQFQDVHHFKYTYDKVVYNGTLKKVIITCSIHGDFRQQPAIHLNGYGCKLCGDKSETGGIYTGKETAKACNKFKFTLDTFTDEAVQIHGLIYEYFNLRTENHRTIIDIKCKIHGVFTMQTGHHLQGYGCKKCSVKMKQRRLDMRSNNEEFIKKARKVHGDIYDYSEVDYITAAGDGHEVTIICKKHGAFKQKPTDHLAGNGCSKCSRSGFSKPSIKWLQVIENLTGIQLEHAMNMGEKRIKLQDGKIVRADGFDNETNTIFEFHGCFWHGCDKCYTADEKNSMNKKKMSTLLANTNKREQQLRDMGFTVIVIWDHEWKLIENDEEKIRVYVESLINDYFPDNSLYYDFMNGFNL